MDRFWENLINHTIEQLEQAVLALGSRRSNLDLKDIVFPPLFPFRKYAVEFTILSITVLLRFLTNNVVIGPIEIWLDFLNIVFWKQRLTANEEAQIAEFEENERERSLLFQKLFNLADPTYF